MFRKLATTTLTTLVAATAFSAMMAGPAAAGNACKQVYLKVVNQTGGSVKIIDLDYWNPATNRYKSEPTRNKVIPNGQPWSDVRSLEQVNARQTWIRIKYRKAKTSGFKKWTKVLKTQSAAAVCGKGSTFQVVLN